MVDGDDLLAVLRALQKAGAAEPERLVAGKSLEGFVTGIATVLNATANILETTKRLDLNILGLDFGDLSTAGDGDLVRLKKVVLKKSCGGWDQIVNYSWVIFCNNIGQVIRPFGDVGDCRLVSLHTGHDYLAAAVRSLQQVSDKSCGHGLVRITETLYWAKQRPINKDCGNHDDCK